MITRRDAGVFVPSTGDDSHVQITRHEEAREEETAEDTHGEEAGQARQEEPAHVHQSCLTGEQAGAVR